MLGSGDKAAELGGGDPKIPAFWHFGGTGRKIAKFWEIIRVPPLAKFLAFGFW